jgi:hypothetical protein
MVFWKKLRSEIYTFINLFHRLVNHPRPCRQNPGDVLIPSPASTARTLTRIAHRPLKRFRCCIRAPASPPLSRPAPGVSTVFIFKAPYQAVPRNFFTHTSPRTQYCEYTLVHALSLSTLVGSLHHAEDSHT